MSWHRNAVDAARQTRVQLLVRSSIIGVGGDSPAESISAHTACDRYLADSGLPLCEHPAPNLFLQNIPESTIPPSALPAPFYANAGSVLCRASSVLSPSLVAGQVALFLSPRTIDAYLRSIHAKLGITSRSQLRDTDLANAEGIDPR